ncbi:hypothetical protein [Halorientalis marina]|uniref:hypothetical protein n=1 Tax=Halorientalis marina TaxID=2931976 RepID=UPI001FF334F9|nr:hypothetical protein [Halorientalis marina]
MVDARIEGIVDRVRRPEYTGENRCVPCTAANLVIAAVASLFAGWLASVPGGLVVGGAVGGVVFAASVAAITLRGYLVPGTPELTKRYLPDRVLAAFGKAPRSAGEGPAESVDVEAALWEAGVLEEQPHGDLGLTDAFATEWRRRIEDQREAGTEREMLAEIVGVDPETITFEEFGEVSFVAKHENRRLGRWESRAAFLADAAGGDLLPEYYDGWASASPAARGQLLAGLRLFIERCPACDGDVRFGQEVVESCCRRVPVVAVTCEDCDARLFEVDAPEEMREAASA